MAAAAARASLPNPGGHKHTSANHQQPPTDEELATLKSLKFDEGFCQWLPPEAFLVKKDSISTTAPAFPDTNFASGGTGSGGVQPKSRRDSNKPFKFVHFRDPSSHIKHYREEYSSRLCKMHRKDLEVHQLLSTDIGGFYERLRRNKNGGATIINGQMYFKQDELTLASDIRPPVMSVDLEGFERNPAIQYHTTTAAGGAQPPKQSSGPMMGPLQRTRSIPHCKPRGYYQMPFFNITGKVLKMMPREFEDDRYED